MTNVAEVEKNYLRIKEARILGRYCLNLKTQKLFKSERGHKNFPNTVKLGYNELGYNELGYNELGYNEHSVITNTRL